MLTFSSLITTKNSYRNFWHQLKKILDENQIKYQLLENTKDVWCRDYMPVRANDGEFIQFIYKPKDLKDLPQLKTNPDLVKPYPRHVKKINIIADGGSLIVGENILFYSSKLIDENGMEKNDIEKILCRYFKVKKTIQIKRYPHETTGHIDGLVRIINERQLFYSDVHPSITYTDNLLRGLMKSGMELIPFPYFEVDRRNKYDDYTAVGCYLNYLELNNFILLPTFNHPKDEDAFHLLREYFPNKKILQVPSLEVAEYGGVLNCISCN